MAKHYLDMGNDPDNDLEEIERIEAIATGIERMRSGVPYISTDRADLQRILEHADRIRKQLESTPTSSARVTTAQWQALTQELYSMLALTRRIKERIANG